MPSRDPASVQILVCDELDPIAISELRDKGFEPTIKTGLSEDELIEALPGVHALLVRSATKVTARVLEAAKDLELVGRAGVGVDNVDVATATSQGVVVMNTPTGNTVTTAELAISLMCSLARHIPAGNRRVREGSWSKKGLMGMEITGKTLGVVGLGRIGAEVAKRAQGLCMKVVAHDPYLAATGASSPVAGVELMGLEEVLAQSDVVTLHVPLMDSTRNMIGPEQIAKMKPGARLINAARGGLVDEAALIEALDSGHLAGAAFDVLAEEPPGPNHPLVNRDDVIVTPHLGASSKEAQVNVAVQVAQQTATFFLDGVAQNAINLPALTATERRALGPWSLLAKSMGHFLAQRTKEPISKIEFTVLGTAQLHSQEHLERSLLCGVLKQSLDKGVNLVNAPLLAAHRGIRILRGESGDVTKYGGLLRARVSCKGGTESHMVAGTVFGEMLRFVRVDGADVDIDPHGSMLITRHHDRPGVVGAIGTTLGSAHINIKRVELGPASTSSEGLASAFLSLYDRPALEILEAIAMLEPVVSADLVDLG
ncbi:MAG: phosphoglycerate dehydrogenase [Planctomycetes bacterium]|nr:phosphoglycerate dehydrogenase [Planctomycetota bacterium]